MALLGFIGWVVGWVKVGRSRYPSVTITDTCLIVMNLVGLVKFKPTRNWVGPVRSSEVHV